MTERVGLLWPGHFCPTWDSSNGPSLLRAPHWVGLVSSQFCIAVGVISCQSCFLSALLSQGSEPYPNLKLSLPKSAFSLFLTCTNMCYHTKCVPNSSQWLLPRWPNWHKYLHGEGTINGRHDFNSCHNWHSYYLSQLRKTLWSGEPEVKSTQDICSQPDQQLSQGQIFCIVGWVLPIMALGAESQRSSFYKCSHQSQLFSQRAQALTCSRQGSSGFTRKQMNFQKRNTSY